MTQDDLDAILKRIERMPDGRIRAVASKYLSGKLKGPFKYKVTRDDDPNDIVPHQHRRELRGLRVISAWLNHYDTKENNSLDVYTDEGYIKHYLIDFGSTLGSQGNEPMPPDVGHENTVDPHAIITNIHWVSTYVHGRGLSLFAILPLAISDRTFSILRNINLSFQTQLLRI